MQHPAYLNSAHLGRPLLDGSRLPLLIEPPADSDDLLRFAVLYGDEIKRLLLTYGAILLRDFRVNTEIFGTFTDALFGGLLNYVYRSTPRDAVADRIYTATSYPANRLIPLHCESSYQLDWPMNLAFHCAQPASSGGETPLADMLRVTERIGPSLVGRFRRRGVRYVRNYSAKIDLPWTEVFQTENRADVERFCRESDIELTWGDDDELRTIQVCQATATHPVLGVEVWFNQAHLFHVSGLGPEMEATMMEVFGLEKLPRNAFYGDGEAIDFADIRQIGACFASEAVMFSWKQGDILLIDNMQVAHGRQSYTGSRRVLVTMGQCYSAVI